MQFVNSRKEWLFITRMNHIKSALLGRSLVQYGSTRDTSIAGSRQGRTEDDSLPRCSTYTLGKQAERKYQRYNRPLVERATYRPIDISILTHIPIDNADLIDYNSRYKGRCWRLSGLVDIHEKYM